MTSMEYVGAGALVIGFIISLITLFKLIKKSLNKESLQKIMDLSKDLEELKKLVQKHNQKFEDIEKKNQELTDKVSGLCAKIELMYDSLKRIENYIIERK